MQLASYTFANAHSWKLRYFGRVILVILLTGIGGALWQEMSPKYFGGGALLIAFGIVQVVYETSRALTIWRGFHALPYEQPNIWSIFVETLTETGFRLLTIALTIAAFFIGRALV